MSEKPERQWVINERLREPRGAKVASLDGGNFNFKLARSLSDYQRNIHIVYEGLGYFLVSIVLVLFHLLEYQVFITMRNMRRNELV